MQSTTNSHDLEQMGPGWPSTTRPVVYATRGVVSSGHYLTSMAGMRMLLNGGNAFDAHLGGPGGGGDGYGHRKGEGWPGAAPPSWSVWQVFAVQVAHRFVSAWGRLPGCGAGVKAGMTQEGPRRSGLFGGRGVPPSIAPVRARGLWNARLAARWRAKRPPPKKLARISHQAS